MNLLQFLNHQAGGNQRFHIDKRADGWRIKPRSFTQYLDNDNVIETLQDIDGIKSAQLEQCSIPYSSKQYGVVIVKTTIRPKEIEIPNFNGGKVKIKEDIHYSSCFGLISRSEAVENGYEVELTPYIEKGTYTFTQYDGNGIVLIHIDENDYREFEFDFKADWLEFI
ncbi:hypothetical protein OAA15_00815 [bacterium]|nr:hypothetical protein [bacterium]